MVLLSGRPVRHQRRAQRRHRPARRPLHRPGVRGAGRARGHQRAHRRGRAPRRRDRGPQRRASATAASTVPRSEVETLSDPAGLTPRAGPAVKVTLDDAPEDVLEDTTRDPLDVDRAPAGHPGRGQRHVASRCRGRHHPGPAPDHDHRHQVRRQPRQPAGRALLPAVRDRRHRHARADARLARRATATSTSTARPRPTRVAAWSTPLRCCRTRSRRATRACSTSPTRRRWPTPTADRHGARVWRQVGGWRRRASRSAAGSSGVSVGTGVSVGVSVRGLHRRLVDRDEDGDRVALVGGRRPPGICRITVFLGSVVSAVSTTSTSKPAAADGAFGLALAAGRRRWARPWARRRRTG